MKENLLSAIKAHDFTAIRNICFALSEEERNDLIHTLQTAAGNNYITTPISVHHDYKALI